MERILKTVFTILALPILILIWFILGVFLLTMPIVIFFFPNLIEFTE